MVKNGKKKEDQSVGVALIDPKLKVRFDLLSCNSVAISEKFSTVF